MTVTALNGYEEFLSDLKTRIRSTQVRAALVVNCELVLLYWQIGRDILARQEREGWGAKVAAWIRNNVTPVTDAVVEVSRHADASDDQPSDDAKNE